MKFLKIFIGLFFIFFNFVVIISNMPENIILNGSSYLKLKKIQENFYPQSWNFFSPMPIMGNELLFAYCKEENKVQKIDAYEVYINEIKKAPFDSMADIALSFRTMTEVFVTDFVHAKNFICPGQTNCHLSDLQINNIPSLWRIQIMAREACRARATKAEFYYSPVIRLEYAPLQSHKHMKVAAEEIQLPYEKAFLE